LQAVILILYSKDLCLKPTVGQLQLQFFTILFYINVFMLDVKPEVTQKSFSLVHL